MSVTYPFLISSSCSIPLQYILSAEIVLSPDQDTVHLQVAWLPPAIDTKVVTEVFEQFESMVLSTAEGNTHSAPPVVPLTTAFCPPQPNVYPSVVDTIESSSIDASLLDSLRSIISDFLGVDAHLLGDTTPFISLGLDSIKSVGMARTLQAQGHKVSPVELMKCSSLKRLAALLVSTSSMDTNQDQEMNALYDTIVQQLRNTVDSRFFRLTTHDTVEIYPTTPLQAGMLSQVSIDAFSLRLLTYAQRPPDYRIPRKIICTRVPLDSLLLRRSWEDPFGVGDCCRPVIDPEDVLPLRD